MHRRQLLRYLAATGVGFGAPHSMGQAQESFPSRPIRIMVASGPGALIDKVTRLYAERMSTYFKQTVLVDNVAGAGSLLAIRQLLKAPPDGYTLMTSANTMVSVSLLNRSAGYTVKDLSPIAELARSPQVLVVSNSSPYQSLHELVAAAKKNPGQLSYASGGVGTTGHLPMEMFLRQAGITLTHIPYKGIAAAIPDVASGRVTLLTGTPTSSAELIKSGALRALAISSETRSPRFPNVPTFKELGYPDGTYALWVGMVAPPGMSAAVKARLVQALDTGRADREIAANLEGAGQEISPVRTPEQFEAVLRAEEEKVRKIIKEANITAE